MPPGTAWQLLGRSVGANPTPMAYAETYTGLQTGAIDGQDNPLPNVQNMKFYEVMSQIVLTSHLVAIRLLCMNIRRGMPCHLPSRRASRPGRQGVWPWSVGEHLKRRRNLPTASRSRGSTYIRADNRRLPRLCAEVYLTSG